ncbi:MAG TPA: CocE/NonD family hydrolase [Xanthomonadales bacterium]|nr:CocE/NonD family hydrolase [Xanthomonadales bacterium]
MSNLSCTQVTVQQNVRVPMRDGVHLATDVYLPADQSQPLPVILERTPYDRQGLSRSERSRESPEPMLRPEIAGFFVRHGFAVVMQDCRGRYDSEGVFTKYLAEGDDGYDTLEWIAAQPWCDGRVATMGLSYGAHTQLAMACLAPPALACMFLDSGGFANAFQGGIRRGGAFELKQVTWAHRHALLSPETAANPERKAALEQVDLPEWFRNMPWWPGHSPLAAAPEFEEYLFDQWHKGRFDSYWQQVGLWAEGYYDRIPDMPVAIVGSWYDPYAGACLANYQGLASRHQSPTCLLMGPWTHGNRSVSYSGDVDFGENSTLDGSIAEDYLHYRLAWFRQCLFNQVPDGGSPRPGITWFEMGGGDGKRNPDGRVQHGGQWRSGPNWPPLNSRDMTLYLRADQSLAPLPETESQSFEYSFDPQHPVPTVGGAITSGEPLMFGGAFDQRAGARLFEVSTAGDTIPLAEREDVLVFQTGILEEDLVLTGTVCADLWISSDCPDTDFTIKLVDVCPANEDFPDGFCMNIADGILRCRFREGWEQEVFMQAGKVYPIRIETLPASNRFKAGHRLRLDISSSNFPQFDVNPNNGEWPGSRTKFRVAQNRVHLGEAYPSSITLQVTAAS